MPMTAIDGLAFATTLLMGIAMAESDAAPSRKRPMSHKEYLEGLKTPSDNAIRRISEIQLHREQEIDAKYHTHTAEQQEAGTRIQKAYRGHRERRELQGLTLDASSRWLETIRELQWRTAAAPPRRLSDEGRASSPMDVARANWRRIGLIAEHAAGDGSSPRPVTPEFASDPGFQAPQLPKSMLMDQRYFLEMVDQKHRYGTNLQVYHEAWQRSETHQNFFSWLDHGAGRHLSLAGCSRDKLDKERIRYLTRDERMDYLVQVDEEGRLRWQKNGELITTSSEEYKDSMHGIVPKDADEPTFGDGEVLEANDSDTSSVDSDSPEVRLAHQQVTKDKTPHAHHHWRVSPATILNHLLRASVKPGTWIYVADTVGRLYVGIKSSGAFQHASFLAGARISSAGSIGMEDGRLTYLSPLSGHYRPTTKSFKDFIDSLQTQGVDLSRLRVSGAYRVLRGMEVYNKTTKGFGKRRRHREKPVG